VPLPEDGGVCASRQNPASQYPTVLYNFGKWTIGPVGYFEE
jgi:hypothetical protein